jgi:hypothetical protein
LISGLLVSAGVDVAAASFPSNGAAPRWDAGSAAANVSSIVTATNAKEESDMGFDQYHEPAEELSADARTFARMITSLTEEAEAISWYAQRMELEPDPQARAIMANAQGEEFKHFGMDLEFLLRRTPDWRIALQKILFTDGDIVAKGEEAEEAENR